MEWRQLLHFFILRCRASVFWTKAFQSLQHWENAFWTWPNLEVASKNKMKPGAVQLLKSCICNILSFWWIDSLTSHTCQQILFTLKHHVSNAHNCNKIIPIAKATAAVHQQQQQKTPNKTVSVKATCPRVPSAGELKHLALIETVPPGG